MTSAQKLKTKRNIRGYTWIEIARHMGVNEATVRSYFKRGIKKLARNREYRQHARDRGYIK